LLHKDDGDCSWKLEGACRLHPRVSFVARDAESVKQARAICAQCGVKLQCLAWALAHNDLGVWGGTTASERRGLRARGRIAGRSTSLRP
jgi:WhiB family transcriptional regulator, redox-sensing transcriptional regulator